MCSVLCRLRPSALCRHLCQLNLIFPLPLIFPGGVVIAIAVPQLVGIFLGRMFEGQIEGQWDRLNKERRRKKAARARHEDRTRY